MRPAREAAAGGEDLEILFRRGLDHEAPYKQSLVDSGLEVVPVALDGHDRAALQTAEAETVRLMEAGVDVVYQGDLIRRAVARSR